MKRNERAVSGGLLLDVAVRRVTCLIHARLGASSLLRGAAFIISESLNSEESLKNRLGSRGPLEGVQKLGVENATSCIPRHIRDTVLLLVISPLPIVADRTPGQNPTSSSI